MALFLSFAVGMGLPVGLEFLKNSLNTEGEVESCLGVPVLGAIPVLTLNSGRRRLWSGPVDR